jgi:hypothetical protein
VVVVVDVVVEVEVDDVEVSPPGSVVVVSSPVVTVPVAVVTVVAPVVDPASAVVVAESAEPPDGESKT